MKTFLINFELTTYYYMDGNKTNSKTILVEAEDEHKAIETLKKYYDDKSDKYSVSYGVYDYEVMESLKQSEILTK